jgi:hypothetical protein
LSLRNLADARRFFAIALTAFGLFSATPLSAQACAGFPPFAETRYRVAAEAASYSYATNVGASLSAGVSSAFATLAGGRTRDAELDASTLDLSLTSGIEVAAGRSKPTGGPSLFVCPVVAATVTFGPHDFLGSESDYRSNDLAIALRIGSSVGRVSQVAIIPAVEIRASRMTMKHLPSPDQIEAGVPGWTRSDTYQLISAAVGFAFKDMWTIRPSLSVPFGFVPPEEESAFVVPFGREDREISFGISMSINFGKRTRDAS